jgi:hypothetical protein
VENSRSPLMCVLSFAVVMTVTAARPAVATAQDVSSNIEAPLEAAASDREPRTRGIGTLAPEARIAFGVRRGAIQRVVASSPFDDVYGMAVDPSETVTIITVHRFGQRAAGGVRVLSSDAPTAMRLGPSEAPFRIGPHPPIIWNLADRVRIAFGGGVRSMPMLDTGLDRPTAPIGSLTIEFGDRK